MKRQIVISLSILTFLTIATIIVIFYGKGYQLIFTGGKPEFSGTGLLVATSIPDGAQVFINGHLTTATDNTINLAPGSYSVKIYKEGYFPWEKNITVQKEVVSKAEALLYPTAPSFEPITSTGVAVPIIDPSKTRIAFTVASQSARKNGIYVLDMNARPILTLQSAATQISDDTIDTFSQSILSWSPDGKELIATTSGQQNNSTTYLLNSSSFNDNPQDITATLENVNAQWTTDKNQINQSRLNGVKALLKDTIQQDFHIISWSPDETKILYQASTSARLPIIITPRLIGVNSTEEQRQIEKSQVYTYDIKEDRNFRISAQLLPLDMNENTQEKATEEAQLHLVQQPLQWFPDSNHLIYVHDGKIDMEDYDGSNVTTIYAGPFIDNYVFPWPDSSKIVILTNLGNPTITPNLYTIGLK